MREIRQLEALDAVQASSFHATIQVCVGFGKTILSMRILKAALEAEVLKPGAKILFQTSSTNLLEAYKKEALLCKDWYEFNPFDHFDITLACYQSNLASNQFDYIINDEIDFVGVELSKPIEKYTGKMLNMSGTMSTSVMIGEKTKKDWITGLASVVYEYTLEQGIIEGILVPFNTTIVLHRFETISPYSKVFKNQEYPVSEQKFWDMTMTFINKNRNKPFLTRTFGGKLTQLCQLTPSKVFAAKKLIKSLKGKRILVWARNNDYLSLIVGAENVASAENVEVIERFNNKEINVIATSKKLTRGFTPTEIDVLIMLHPIGSITEFEQLLGRAIRTDIRPDKVASLYIFCAIGSYDENWMRRGLVEKKNKEVVRVIDLNITNYIDSSKI